MGIRNYTGKRSVRYYVRRGATCGQLSYYMIGALGVGRKITCQKIGEEKNLQNREHDEQLEEYDLPQGFAYYHGTKTVAVKGINGSHKHRRPPPEITHMHSCKLLPIRLHLLPTHFLVKLFVIKTVLISARVGHYR